MERSEADWVTSGWQALVSALTADSDSAQGFLDEAHACFGNALKIDDTYAPGYIGEGWTYLYEHNPGSAMDEFQNCFLYAGGLADTDEQKRMLYVGAMVALFMQDDYTNSVAYGLVYDDMDPNRTLSFSHHTSFSAYDAIMYLTLNYFALGNEVRVEEYINALCDIIGQPDWTFTTWDDCATKIAELQALDPS
jgi:tetratricopeptide (TPR) repeat protein